jgi:hypothetical protein
LRQVGARRQVRVQESKKIAGAFHTDIIYFRIDSHPWLFEDLTMYVLSIVGRDLVGDVDEIPRLGKNVPVVMRLEPRDLLDVLVVLLVVDASEHANIPLTALDTGVDGGRERRVGDDDANDTVIAERAVLPGASNNALDLRELALPGLGEVHVNAIGGLKTD